MTAHRESLRPSEFPARRRCRYGQPLSLASTKVPENFSCVPYIDIGRSLFVVSA
jgi:hypothetical protein